LDGSHREELGWGMGKAEGDVVRLLAEGIEARWPVMAGVATAMALLVSDRAGGRKGDEGKQGHREGISLCEDSEQ
jgi:hypothetical protein